MPCSFMASEINGLAWFHTKTWLVSVKTYPLLFVSGSCKASSVAEGWGTWNIWKPMLSLWLRIKVEGKAIYLSVWRKVHVILQRDQQRQKTPWHHLALTHIIGNWVGFEFIKSKCRCTDDMITQNHPQSLLRMLWLIWQVCKSMFWRDKDASLYTQ